MFLFIIVSVEIQSYDHWFEQWCANGKSTLINAHTANNERRFSVLFQVISSLKLMVKSSIVMDVPKIEEIRMSHI